MFDIGFFEIALIGVVLLIVMGPERLPDVARQAAFLVRKARGWMYNIKSEMEMGEGSSMESLRAASQEITDFKKDISQFGKDIAEDVESVTGKVDDFVTEHVDEKKITDSLSLENSVVPSAPKAEKKKPATKKSVAKKPVVKKKPTASKKATSVAKPNSGKTTAAKKAPAKKKPAAKKAPAVKAAKTKAVK
jgi:sec-independent protein translocase protein TatB